MADIAPDGPGRNSPPSDGPDDENNNSHVNNRNEGGGGGAENKKEAMNIKVTDNNNEVFFKIKPDTKLGKLMTAFCDRQGKNILSVRFLFEGQRVNDTDTPEKVRSSFVSAPIPCLGADPMNLWFRTAC
jgi:hypothetical protein